MPSPSVIIPHSISLGLLAAGAAAYGLSAGPLLTDDPQKQDTLHDAVMTPPNPFGVNTSPYGEVLAMAMQGPIDTYWHKGVEDAGAASQDDTPGHEGHDHGDHDHDAAHTSEAKPPPPGMAGFLEQLSEACDRRTNPKPASRAQEFSARREIENKLRFAYELDPAHYANYNTYHFFLTEPQVGTRPELTKGAAQLAEKTVRYCLARTDDPRPALTAAAAAENVLQLMFNDRLNPNPQFSTAQMRGILKLVDQSLARYQEISAQWQATGNWQLLSEQRRAECAERFYFINKVREAAEHAIQRYEREAPRQP